MKKFDWKDYIYKVVIVILISFFMIGVGFGAAEILSIEGNEEIYTPAKSLSPVPDTHDEIIAYVNSCIKIAHERMPKVDYSQSFDIDSNSLSVSGNGSGLPAFSAAVNHIIGPVKDAVEASYESTGIDFYSSNKSLVPLIKVNADDISGVTLSYEYYKCKMCNESVSVQDFSDTCPACSNKDTLKLRYNDVYTIEIFVKTESETFKNNPFPISDDIKTILQNEAKIYKLSKFAIKHDSARIYVEINRLTDKINKLEFITDSSVDTTIEYNDAPFEISCKVNEKSKLNFTWPGVSLNTHKLALEKKGTDVLKATLSCDDPLLYEVTWTSSDENICEVDEEGYLTAGKEFGNATITASFTFGDITYTDSCDVRVCVPAEGMDLSKGKLKLKTGETYQIFAKMKPKDTTDTLVFWHSEDKSIATVDEEGKITGVSEGVVVIYAISNDGNYYSSCTVEVTE
ncbi:MAG TPA: hypothetical protein GXZ23_03780 [Clostridiales bacterium]|nr:hypothetical protein [Clostridiales bacterium]